MSPWRPAVLAATCAATLSTALPRDARAHDLLGTSATLVVRDGGFVELRLLVAWSDVLRARWMPRATPEVFLGSVANQSPAAFARAYAQVLTQVEHDLRLVANRHRELPFAHWRWPAPADVQSALRTELMARLATPSADVHAERLASTADVDCAVPLTGVQLQSAAVLGPVLVTTYRPAQQFVRAGARSTLFVVSKP
jgi:hypothetical protein